MDSPNSVATRTESGIYMLYKSEGYSLELQAQFEEDLPERMEVDGEFSARPTSLKMQLTFHGGSFQPLETTIVFPDVSSIHHDERGIALFLNSFVRSSADVVTVVRVVSVKLSGMNVDGSHLVPENEAVSVTKLGRDPRAFSYESTANDIIPKPQFELLASFIGSHPTTPWLISVLRVLAELAVKSCG